jgi:hypothetical protein
VVSAFPAFEVYDDRPAGGGVASAPTTVAQMWPRFGPTGLLWQQAVGDVKLLTHFDESWPDITTTRLGPASGPPSVVVVK